MALRTLRISALSVLGCLLAACGRPAEAPKPSDGKIPVFVSILPQATFVKKIGGDAVDVEVMVKPGYEPATYDPTPKQMRELSRAEVYFAIGVPFEAGLMPRFESVAPKLRVVKTQEGVPLRRMARTGAHEEKPEEGRHDHGHDRERGGHDPHIWMSPRLVKIQAATIRAALSKLRPKLKPKFEANLRAFDAELDKLDKELKKALAPIRGRCIFVFHPAFGYFCDAYGLKQRAVEIEGKSPGPRRLAELIEHAKRAGVRVIFVEPQFSHASAEVIAKSIHGAVVPLDPLAADYVANLRKIAATLRKELAPGTGAKGSESKP